MPLAIPPELKKVTPFIRRAEELDRTAKTNPESRLVAYYCRQYAVHTGIPLATLPESKQCLGTILGELEKEKPAMSNFTRDESKFVCRQFSDTIFNKADSEDRMGMATKTTAKTFYAAASFYEILGQFYEENEVSEEYAEVQERTKYAKWKATDILKAIREGREPTPGGYGEGLDDDGDEGEEEPTAASGGGEANQEPTETSSSLPPPPVLPPVVETVQDDDEEPTEAHQPQEEEDYNDEGTEVGLGGLGPPPDYPGESLPDEVFVADSSIPHAASDRPPLVPPPAYKPPTAAKPPSPQKKSSSFFGKKKKKTTNDSGKVSKAALADAVELTSFALAALKDKDAELGATRLEQALAALGR